MTADPDLRLPDGLAAPARRALAGAGVTRLDRVAELSEDQLSSLHGMGAHAPGRAGVGQRRGGRRGRGPKAIGLLRTALAAHGMSFAGGQRQ